MRRSILSLPALAASLLLAGACARDLTQPLRPPALPRAALSATDGTYLVAFKGGLPADLQARVAELGGTVTYSHAGAGIASVTGLTAATAAALAAGKDVADVQPDTEIGLAPAAVAPSMDAGNVGVASQGNPATASRYAWQWNMRAIHADQAWAAGKLGSSAVTVAILDTGIDYDAPDLSGLVDLARSKSFVASDNALTSQYFSSRNEISDYNGHGTNVATQVSSKARALAGVTSMTTLIGVKVLAQNGYGSFSAIMNGVLYAADQGANVANMSLGGGFAKAGMGRYVGFINRVFNYAAARGMLIVVAAGNDAADLDHDGNSLVTYCNQPQVLCVSAVGPTTWTGSPDTFSFFSNFGRSAISVAGPGGNAQIVDGAIMPSVWPWGTDIASWVWSYCSKTLIAGFTSAGAPVLTSCAAGNRLTGYIGTSQATPHVAGLAALLMAETGRVQPSQIKALILKSALDLGQPGVDPFFGRGRIDVARALGL